jgi:hypothetical protein
MGLLDTRPRNPALFRRGLYGAMNKGVAHRVIYIPSVACPSKDCPGESDATLSCASCGLLSNSFKQIYSEPTVVKHSHSAWRAPVPPNQELLEHRWLVSDPVIADNQGKVWNHETDFTLEQRRVTWNKQGPENRSKYTISYDAFAEDSVYFTHAMLHGQDEEGIITPTALVEQGTMMVSIGPEASCYNLRMGDILIPVDWEMSGGQIMDITLPSRRAMTRWVIKIQSAFYRRRTQTGWEMVDITEDVTYNFETQEYVFKNEGALLEAGVGRISITVLYCPMYTVNLDVGEARANPYAQQPRYVQVKRLEIAR